MNIKVTNMGFQSYTEKKKINEAFNDAKETDLGKLTITGKSAVIKQFALDVNGKDALSIEIEGKEVAIITVDKNGGVVVKAK